MPDKAGAMAPSRFEAKFTAEAVKDPDWKPKPKDQR